MSDCVLVLGRAEAIPDTDCDLIGADRGALYAAEKGRRLKLAAGDFDSVSPAEMELIEAMSDEVVRLLPEKDESDSEWALREALRRGYSRITVIGALGGRIDHEVVNLRLAAKYPGRVVLKNGTNLIRALAEGDHEIAKEGLRYLSLLPVTACCITLRGFKYPLEKRAMTPADLYGLSNEISGDTGYITVHSGIVLVIQSDDSH